MTPEELNAILERPMTTAVLQKVLVTYMQKTDAILAAHQDAINTLYKFIQESTLNHSALVGLLVGHGVVDLEKLRTTEAEFAAGWAIDRLLDPEWHLPVDPDSEEETP